MTEVGRQPWIVYNVMRTSDAVTNASGIWVTFGRSLVLYVALGTALIVVAARDVAALARARTTRTTACRTARTGAAARPRAGDGRMSEADAVAAVLWIGATLYAVFGGADFGAGFWSLLAGGGDRGRRPRELIDWAIGPVWEANHVWLIFVLVVLWTGFSVGVRGDLLDAVHPAQPRGARHRAARLGLRVPAHRAAGAGAGRWP